MKSRDYTGGGGKIWFRTSQDESLLPLSLTQKIKINVPERFFVETSGRFFLLFGLWATDLAIFDLKFGFCMSKSSPGTISQVVRLDSFEKIAPPEL